MTNFDETTPLEPIEHDMDSQVEETALDEAAIQEAIEKAEEFAVGNEELLLQEGEGDFEKEPAEEAPKKKSSKSKKKAESTSSKEELSDSAEPDATEEDTGVPEDISEVLDTVSEEGLIKSPRERATDSRYYMDEDGKYVEDVASPYREHHQRLSSAFNRRDLLSGIVEGFELNGMDMPRVFLYCGDIKVVIPLAQLDLQLSEEQQQDPLEARLAVNAILGAKIYYMVLDINFPSKVAVASRSYANRRRRNANINHVNRDGVYKIRPGVLCTAQLIHIAQRFVRIDIYGFQTSIGIGQISNLWVNDIREVLDVGTEVMVEIVAVERNPESGEAVAIQASMKMAEYKTVVNIEQNMTYTGTVSGFSSAAYFVRVSGVEKDVRCPIGKCYTGKLIEIGDYVKFFVDHFRGEVPSGSILKILKKTGNSLQDF